MTATAFMVRPFVRGHRTFDSRIWRLLVVGGVPLMTLAVLNLIYTTLDIPILHALVGSEPVGWYAVAWRWVGIPIFITTAVTSAYYPAFSAQGNPLTEQFAPLVNRAVHIVLFVTIPASFGLVFVADEVIRLMYEQEFDSSIVLIQILAVGLPLIALDTVLATALIASDRLKGYLVVAAIAACLNPVVSAIAISITDSRYGNGAIGAAITTVATELWILGGALYFRSPGVLDRTQLGRVGRILAATALMAPALLLSAGLPLAVQVVFGIATYGLASLAFGSISVSELREIVQRSTPKDAPHAGDEPSADSATRTHS
jgi:O-antigen/teichoic acid export membrane protein